MPTPADSACMAYAQRLTYSAVLVLLAVAGIARAGECAPPEVSGVVRGPLGERLDRHVRSGTKLGFSGNVLVAQGGEIVLHHGYGMADRGNCLPVTNETAFWIGSLSKQFVGAAILRLHEQGKLALDDPLGKHVENLPDGKRAITIHQLLTHTSGLEQRYAADGIADRDKAIRALTRKPRSIGRDRSFVYSNDGYNLLAILVATVSGHSFDAYVRSHLFERAGLEHSTTCGERREGLVVAEPGPGATRSGDPQDWPEDWGFRGATGVITTTGDLYRWYQALRSGSVLEPAGAEMLFQPHVRRREGLHYAYGWQIVDTTHGELIVHSGDDTVISHDSTLRHYVEKELLVIVTANAGYRNDRGVGQLLARELVTLALE
ncbi:MAG: beta-lactamase family protein [bacterium]|nr:beta-lactamase family protein [bacterium]